MSAVKFQCPPYKLFEPDYHPQKPIIVGVDDRLESPETLTLRYEEAARAAEGGDPRGDSPPRLLDMAAYGKSQLPSMHGYEAPRYQDAPYEQYPSQPFSTHDATKFAQLNQQSFASNNAVAPYMSASPAGPTVLSYQPTSGVFGTKVSLRVLTPYDLFSMTPIPYVSILFGTHKVPVQDLTREGQGDDSSNSPVYYYACNADAPQLMVTGCGGSSNVPMALVIEGAAGDEISRTPVGGFQYMMDGGAGASPSSVAQQGDDITRTGGKVMKHDTGAPGQDVDQASGTLSPKTTANEPHHHAGVTSAQAGGAGAHNSAGPVPSLGPDASTNTYDYPPQQGQYGPPGGAFGAQDTTSNNNANTQTAADMITTAYRSSSFTDPSYHHRRSAGHHAWSPFSGAPLGSSTGRSPALGHHHTGHHGHYGSSRPTLTPLPMPSSNSMSSLGVGCGPDASTPTLVRTSTISGSASAGVGGPGSFHPMSLYPNKAVLKINGDLMSMTKDWTQDEWDTRRRIVMFRKSQAGSTLTASFRAVPLSERPPNSICVSCIYWRERGEYYVTSVDTIHLLEQLVAIPNRFTVEEKNRIRRNLEGFHPVTVAKGRGDSEEFFKIIMGFPNPKPRNIEKDVKVFKWSDLSSALKKIIGKYSASPSSTIPPPGSTMISAPPVSISAASSASAVYHTLPTPPGQSLPSHGGDPHSQYHMPSSHGSAHDSIPSPRSLSGAQAPWATGPYSTGPASYSGVSTRGLSPGMRQHGSPHQHQPPPMRINTNTTPLPAVTTYDTRTVTTGGGYGGHGGSSNGGASGTGLHTPISHHPSTATPPRWDPTGASGGYGPDGGYPSLSGHHGTGQQHSVYGSGGYGDGAPRA